MRLQTKEEICGYSRDFEKGKRVTYGSGRGALIFGHNWKNPLSGRFIQSFEPPPQFGTPECPTSEAPIMRMTVPTFSQMSLRHRDDEEHVPVTIGGKMR